MSHQMPRGHLCTVSMRHVSIRVPPSRNKIFCNHEKRHFFYKEQKPF